MKVRAVFRYDVHGTTIKDARRRFATGVGFAGIAILRAYFWRDRNRKEHAWLVLDDSQVILLDARQSGDVLGYE